MMRSADDATLNYKTLVQRGYDWCAAAYAQARLGQANPELDLLARRLPTGARVLGIGCGAGVPIARAPAWRFHVTGIDISGEQVRLAQANVLSGTFLHGDVMAAQFAPATFDAVVAFYVLFHLPYDQGLTAPAETHPLLFARRREA